MEEKRYQVIIIGGSYAGLSAALTLVRSLRTVLVIDDGNPCNKQVPIAHNLIGHDGQTPGEIKKSTKESLSSYPDFYWCTGTARHIEKKSASFAVKTKEGNTFIGHKILFASGLRDIFPKIKGFEACWGKSIFSCPYCDAYELRNGQVALLGNGKKGYEMAMLIKHWCQKVTLFSNGTTQLNDKQARKLAKLEIPVIESEIQEIYHTNGQLSTIDCLTPKTNRQQHFDAAFAVLDHEQRSTLPQSLGCKTLKGGHIKIDKFHQTTIKGVYAAGDCCSLFRSIASSIADGNKTGAFINQQLIKEKN